MGGGGAAGGQEGLAAQALEPVDSRDGLFAEVVDAVEHVSGGLVRRKNVPLGSPAGSSAGAKGLRCGALHRPSGHHPIFID